MTPRDVVLAVLAMYVFTLGHGTAVERSGELCVDTGSAADELTAEYGVRLFAPVLVSSYPTYRRNGDTGGLTRSSSAKSFPTVYPHRIASALVRDPVLHSLYRPEPPGDYHVVVHPLFTARDASAWWNQTWQTALASRWRALALIRKELAREPIMLHPVVRGLHAGRYTLSIELSVDEEEQEKLKEIWDMVRRITGVNFGNRSPKDGSFALRVPIAYRRISPKSGRCCFCCLPRDTFKGIVDEDLPQDYAGNYSEECCMELGETNSDVQKRIEQRLIELLQESRYGSSIVPLGTFIRVGRVQMGHFTRQGDMRTPKHWAIHYLLPGGRDERFPIGAFLCLICAILVAIVCSVVKLRRVPLILWDVKRR